MNSSASGHETTSRNTSHTYQKGEPGAQRNGDDTLCVLNEAGCQLVHALRWVGFLRGSDLYQTVNGSAEGQKFKQLTAFFILERVCVSSVLTEAFTVVYT